MEPIHVRDVLPDRMLVTRASARELQPRLEEAAADPGDRVELDFDGVAGMTPSFFDELLATVEEASDAGDSNTVELVVHNAPTDASSKFQAVAEGHECSLSANEERRGVLQSLTASAS